MSEAIAAFHRESERRQKVLSDPEAQQRRLMSEDVRNRIAATGSKIGELGGVGLHAIAQLSSGAKTPDDFKLRHSAS